MRRARGFTLVEAAIVFTLLGGLMTLIALYFVRGKRYAAETEGYAAVQRAANLIVRRITDDLYRGSFQQAQSDGDSLIFLSFKPVADGDPYLRLGSKGLIIWEKWVAYYLDPAKHAVVRAEIKLDTPTDDVMISPKPEVDADLFRTSTNVERLPLGQGAVKDFSVSSTGRRFEVTLTTRGLAAVSGASESEREIEVTVKSQISLLN